MDVLDIKDGLGKPFAPAQVVYDPANPQRHKTVPSGCRLDDCRSVVMEDGEILHAAPTLDEMANYCAGQLRSLPEGCLRLINPHVYKVGVSERLLDLRDQLLKTPKDS
jgi:nicotinate phosphoribosyltransferase